MKQRARVSSAGQGKERGQDVAQFDTGVVSGPHSSVLCLHMGPLLHKRFIRLVFLHTNHNHQIEWNHNKEGTGFSR